MNYASEIQAVINRLVKSHPESGVAIEVHRNTASEFTYGHRRETEMPAASTTKIAAAIALYDAFLSGDVNPDEETRIGDLSFSDYASVLKDLNPDRKLTLRELCNLSLSISDNPSTQAIIDRIGLSEIQKTLSKLGAVSTSFVSGFTAEELNGKILENITTPNDMLLMLDKIRVTPAYKPIREAMENSRRNTRIPYELDDSIAVAHKTGSLRGLVHDAGFMSLREDLDLTLVFLLKHNNDARGAETAIADASEKIVSTLLKSS